MTPELKARPWWTRRGKTWWKCCPRFSSASSFSTAASRSQLATEGELEQVTSTYIHTAMKIVPVIAERCTIIDVAVDSLQSRDFTRKRCWEEFFYGWNRGGWGQFILYAGIVCDSFTFRKRCNYLKALKSLKKRRNFIKRTRTVIK
jgi:hypothetical protein